MYKLQLLCLAPLWLASLASATNVEGSVAWNFKCKDLNTLHPQTKVVLDGGRYRASIRKDGRFTLYNVPPGSYLLEVLARDHEFDPLRVEVLSSTTSVPNLSNPSDSAQSAALSSSMSSVAAQSTETSANIQNGHGDDNDDDEGEPAMIPDLSASAPAVSEQPSKQVEVEIRPAPLGTPFHPAGSAHLQALPLLPYPIVLEPKGEKVYVVAQKGFDVLEMFKNPMMLMMLVAGVMVFLLPKALENMDPDIVKDMRERQDKMYNLQSSIQNGDFGALKAELTARVPEPSSSSSSGNTKPRALAAGSGPAEASPASGYQAPPGSGSGKKSGQGRKKR